MTMRFCHGCAMDVEDAGGFCLLGHRLSLDPPVASLQELREESAASFQEAQDQSAFRSDDVIPPSAPLEDASGPNPSLHIPAGQERVMDPLPDEVGVTSSPPAAQTDQPDEP